MAGGGPRAVRLLWRAFGARGLFRRLVYVLSFRIGWLRRRTPAQPDHAGFVATPWEHRFDLEQIRAAYSGGTVDPASVDAVLSEASSLLEGTMRLYGSLDVTVGWPPDWHRHPTTGHRYPLVHWSEISDDDADAGDIKDVWELSRLSFTFPLARAHAATGDEAYADRWWEAFEDWAAANPPNTGVNWRCGQESSLRGIAICFGLSAFSEAAATTPARRQLAERVLTATVERVRPTVGYALSQRNNHAISELVFLLSVRAPGGPRWERLLREALRDQFYDDGSYSQQSTVYQRLAVHALTWLALTRPDLRDDTNESVRWALRRSVAFLGRLCDPVSGLLANHGPNDGALLLHLATLPHRHLGSTIAITGGPAHGAAAEAAAWIRVDVGVAPAEVGRSASITPLYVTLRDDRVLALSRVGLGRHRVGHADQQALELWVDGVPVIGDPGTYRYTAPAPWRNALAGPGAHNGPLGVDDATRHLGRFLVDAGEPARLLHRDATSVVSARRVARGEVVRAVHRHRWGVSIVDVPEGTSVLSRWILPAGRDRVWQSAPTVRVLRSDPDDPLSGWYSDTYGHRSAVAGTVTEVHPGEVALTVVVTGPGFADAERAEDELAGRMQAWLTEAQREDLTRRLTDLAAAVAEGYGRRR
jgi:hypothetical protein